MATLEEFQELLKQAYENPSNMVLLQTLFLEFVRRECDPRPKNNLLIKTINGSIVSIPKNSFLHVEKAGETTSIVIKTSCVARDGMALTFATKKEMDKTMQKIIDFLS